MSSSSEMTQIKNDDLIHSSLPQSEATVPSKPPREVKPPVDLEDDSSLEQEQAPVVPAREYEKEHKENKSRAIIVRTIRHPASSILDNSILPKAKRDKNDLQDDYDDLCREVKSLGRENREQSLELRGLKKQNAHLVETCRARSEHNDSHRDQVQHERDKFYEHAEMLEDQIIYLKQELQRRKGLVESLTVQTREAVAEKGAMELSVRKLQKQNRDLSENLTECKDDLLRLQPPSQTPDSELAEQYSSLAHQISKWVDDETEDTTATEAKFDCLTKNEDLPESLKPYLADEHIRLGKKHPNAQPYILRYLIHFYLEGCIFGEDVHLFGLDSRTIALFEGIEQGMHELEPPRDNVTIRHWRSETLLGLSKMPDFREEQLHQAAAVSHSLHALLTPLLPSTSAADTARKTLHETITLPAISLATSLHLSTSDYRLWTRTPTGSPKNLSIYISAIQKASFIDMATGKILRPDSVLKVNDEGRIGEEMLIVTPSLIRDEKEKGTSQLLVKPSVLVKLDEPMGRRGRMKGLGEWAGSWFGTSPGGEGGNP